MEQLRQVKAQLRGGADAETLGIGTGPAVSLVELSLLPNSLNRCSTATLRSSPVLLQGKFAKAWAEVVRLQDEIMAIKIQALSRGHTSRFHATKTQHGGPATEHGVPLAHMESRTTAGLSGGELQGHHLMRRLDKDGDGSITSEELMKGLKELGIHIEGSSACG